MAQDMNDPTRMMGAGGAPVAEPSYLTGAPGAANAGATQMGATVTCPICHTANAGLETYCGECGFLLSSMPGQLDEGPDEPVFELVENGTGRRFLLRPGANTIGREKSDIILMDGTVSRRHAQITLDNGLVILQDLGSSNGTQVDGNPIGPNHPTPLASGAVLKFGSATLTLSAPEAPAQAVADQSRMLPSYGHPAAPPRAAQPPVASLPPPTAPSAPQPTPQPAAPPQPSFSPPPPPTVGGAQTVGQLKPTASGADPIYLVFGTLSVGRRTSNDVVISGDPYISGHHADILCDNTGCYLTDAGSTNGTSVNGKRLEPHQRQLLLDGDEVTFGQSAYIFETLGVPEGEPFAAAGGGGPLG